MILVAAIGGSATAQQRPRNIVFASNWTPHFRTADIYVVGARGGRARNLTSNEIDDIDPVWSPDARRVAFASDRSGNFELYTMSADGTGVRRLTRTRRPEREPAWSPDGRRLAFVSPGSERTEKGTQPDQIYLLNADGSGVTQVTHQEEGAGDPAWSPDGTKLAAVTAEGIVSMNADGTNLRAIDPGVGDESDFDPAWSPDGRRIAFTAGVAELNTNDVWVMDADGTHARRLARFAAQPTWSPDGRTIAFVNGPVWTCDRDGCFDEGRIAIATIRASGGPRRFVTRPLERSGQEFIPSRRKWGLGEGASFFHISWAPDGRRLVYARRLELRPPDLVAVSPAGGRPVQLTATTSPEWEPAVSPGHARIAFLRDLDNRPFSDLYTIGTDGRGVRHVASAALAPTWSRDGRRLAFTRADIERNRVVRTVFTANGDGTSRRRIAAGHSPTWSPDGRRIAYIRRLDSRFDVPAAIVVANADGTTPRQLLVIRRRVVYYLSWSPTRDQLAFTSSSRRQLGPRYSSWIGILDVETGRIRRLTVAHNDYAPVWSPDGRSIVFTRATKSPYSTASTVCVVRLAAAAVRCLDRFKSRAITPAWSPDGSRLAFASMRDGDYEIYIARPDGSGRRQLTRNTADDVYPSW
jgi:Tol biopolymer transport system component